MKTFALNRVSLAAALAATLVAFAPDEAQARWRGRGSFGSFGSFGGYASYGGYGSYGSYGSYSGYNSAGSYGSSGSYGGYRTHGCYVSAGYGSYGAHGGAYYDSAPTEMYPEATPPIPAPPAEETEPPQANIRLNVPPDARVFVDGRLTTSTGAQRTYVARGLQSGAAYAYRMRVEFAVDGQQVVENRKIDLQAGDAINLTFGGGQQLAEDDAATTELTLRVPEDAKVTLAGTKTSTSGRVRTFATRALADGQEWDDYAVHVEVERDGQTLVEQQTLDVVGGENYDLAFDFEDESIKVAALD